jgi:hypothetical protein
MGLIHVHDKGVDSIKVRNMPDESLFILGEML